MCIQPIDYITVKDKLSDIKIILLTKSDDIKKSFGKDGFISYEDVCTRMSILQAIQRYIRHIDNDLSAIEEVINSKDLERGRIDV